MKNLIPSFIVERFQKQQSSGGLQAIVMFVDMSGFTNMTETLMKGGDEGAEILSDILNRIFTSTENEIYARGGLISTYAGDAFTTIFPIHDDTESVTIKGLWCARRIQEIFEKQRVQQTRFGDFELNAKIGLACGPVEWAIVGAEQKAYFFSGDAIHRSALAEGQAKIGEIVCDPTLYRHLKATQATFHDLGDGMVHLAELYATDNPVLKPRHEVSREIFAHFLPESVLNFSLVGEFRNAVSIFISFSNLTTLQDINQFVSIVLQSCAKFGGYFNKIDYGDKGWVILCIFGAPVAYEKNVERALNYILALKETVSESLALRKVVLKVGISYGVVYAGIVGGERRGEYTVLGDVVNLAARFMAAAGPNQIWVSDTVFKMTNSEYEYGLAGKFLFKGKSAKTTVYTLIAKKENRVRTYSNQLIGHKAEVDLVQNIFEACVNHNEAHAQLIYVYGEPGVGKSRFVYEIARSRKNFYWAELPCDGILQKSFNPFAHFFSLYFKKNTASDPIENHNQFNHLYDYLVSVTTDVEIQAELIRLKSIMAGFLGFHEPGSLYEQLDPKLRYENLLYAFKEFFKALCTQSPVVLHVEDLQWLDPDSRRAFEIIGRNIENFPIVVLCESRYYDDRTLPALPISLPATSIDLNVLADDEVVQMAEAQLGGKISPSLAKTLIEKTLGNPFFVEQTIVFFNEACVIEYQFNEAGQIVWDRKSDDDVLPATITDLLIARVDRLSEGLKQMVQTAAVIGREFDVLLLCSVLERVDSHLISDNIQQDLKTGEHEKIWELMSELRAIFSHSLLQDAVYRMQLKQKRRDLHFIVAERLHQLFADRKDIYADLAFHYEKAEIEDKTIEYLKKAADYAKERYENERAVELYTKLLGFLLPAAGLDPTLPNPLQTKPTEASRPTYELILTALVEKGEILRRIGGSDAAIEAYNLALAFAESLDDVNQKGIITTFLGLTFYSKGDFDQALLKFQTRLSGSEAVNDLNGIATAIGSIGIIHTARGQFDAAMTCFEKKLSLSKELGLEKEIAKALGYLGIVCRFTGNQQKALEYYDQQLEICQRLDDKQEIANINVNKGTVLLESGQLEAALACHEAALKMAKELGYKREISMAIGNIGDVYLELGEYTKALNYFQQKLALSEELGDKSEIAIARGNLGLIHHKLADLQSALSYHDTAIDSLTQLQMKFFLPFFGLDKAEIYLKLNRIDDAKSIIANSLEIAQAMSQTNNIFNAKLLQAKAEALADRLENACDQLKILLSQAVSPEEKANVNYELWTLTAQECYRTDALRLYEALYRKIAKSDYSKKISKLDI